MFTVLLLSFIGQKKIVHLQPGTENWKKKEQIFSPSAFILQRTGVQNWTCTKTVTYKCKVVCILDHWLQERRGEEKKGNTKKTNEDVNWENIETWPFFARPSLDHHILHAFKTQLCLLPSIVPTSPVQTGTLGQYRRKEDTWKSSLFTSAMPTHCNSLQCRGTNVRTKHLKGKTQAVSC